MEKNLRPFFCNVVSSTIGRIMRLRQVAKLPISKLTAKETLRNYLVAFCRARRPTTESETINSTCGVQRSHGSVTLFVFQVAVIKRLVISSLVGRPQLLVARLNPLTAKGIYVYTFSQIYQHTG